MLSKQYRLKKTREFNYVYKKGESKNVKVLTLIYVKTKFKPNKVGFSISNKIGNSVVRHKVKRRLSEIVKFYFNNLNPNFNYVFIAKCGIESLSFDELKKTTESLIKKSGMCN